MIVIKISFFRRWLYCYLLFFVLGCKTNSIVKNISPDHNDSVQLISVNNRALEFIRKARLLITQGDMILRSGNDFTSESLRQLSQNDKTFSHCGIASLENDSIFVYHSLGGEWNPDEKIRRDPLELFCNPDENRGFGVFTFNFNDLQNHRLDSVVKDWYKKGLTFDMDFNLATDDKLYCAEFVSKSIEIATEHSIRFNTSKINNFTFIAIDNLFLNPFCAEKLRVRYE